MKNKGVALRIRACAMIIFCHTATSKVNVFAIMFDKDISTHSGYRDFIWAVELNRFGLEMVGLWPTIGKAAKNSSLSDLRVVISFITVIFLTVIPLICSLVRVWGDMILMIDNLQLTLPLSVISLKLVIMRWKRTGVSFIVTMIAEDWMTVRTDAEKNVMIKRARVARVIIICGYSLIGFTFMLMILPSFGIHFRHLTNLTDRVRELPLRGSYFYETDKSPQFELTFLSQSVGIFVGGIIYTSVDAFFGLAIIHICGQLENFRHRLITLISDINFDTALHNNIKTHLRLIRFAENIENTFTLMALGLIVYFAIVFCLVGFLLLNILSGTDMSDMPITRKLFVLACIIILFSHMLLYCAAGEMVVEQCEEVYRAMCNLEWYNLESRKQKNLILLMLRSNKPLYITAGKIFPLTMSTFCSLVKTSAGYISFLLTKR